MAKQSINLGTPPEGKDGDTARTANVKINANFSELYARTQGSLSKDISGATALFSLTAADTLNGSIALVGAIVADKVVTVPAAPIQAWVVSNATTGAGAVAFRTEGGAGVTIARGRTALLVSDGTNVIEVNPPSSVVIPKIPRRNLLYNACGRVNQRGYVSGAATTAANQYTIDRWRVVVSGQNLAFASAGYGYTFTAPAGGVEEVVEGNNVLGGTHTLSWEGTATATVNGAAVANGGQIDLVAGSNATVRFSGGTYRYPQLERGSEKTDFDFRPYSYELYLCQRYYEAISTTVVFGCAGSVNLIGGAVRFAASKRASPTIVFTSVGTTQPYGIANSPSVSGVTIDSCTLTSTGSSLTVGYCYTVGMTLLVSAEL